MNILVLCGAYPNLEGDISLNYVHTRNVSYQNNWEIDVTVLNFKTQHGYIKDGIKVISLNEFKEDNVLYDILVCHAANLKSHYQFLKKYDKLFSRIVFFYHGHEVMKLTSDYPAEYYYKKRNRYKDCLISVYDNIKLKIWKRYILSNKHKLQLVFVSEWMLDIFEKNLRVDRTLLEGIVNVIYNSVSKDYESLRYDAASRKQYDYVTIRGNLDTSKFAIDLVNKFAFANPDKKFLLVGKGEFFNHYKKADNIDRIERYLNQHEIVELLNTAKCALMPTRCDAQGVMACEMATFGIPVITSDISVCRAVLKDFKNVALISNESDGTDLASLTAGLTPCVENVNDRFFEAQTVGKEVELYKRMLQ